MEEFKNKVDQIGKKLFSKEKPIKKVYWVILAIVLVFIIFCIIGVSRTPEHQAEVSDNAVASEDVNPPPKITEDVKGKFKTNKFIYPVSSGNPETLKIELKPILVDFISINTYFHGTFDKNMRLKVLSVIKEDDGSYCVKAKVEKLDQLMDNDKYHKYIYFDEFYFMLYKRHIIFYRFKINKAFSYNQQTEDGFKNIELKETRDVVCPTFKEHPPLKYHTGHKDKIKGMIPQQ